MILVDTSAWAEFLRDTGSPVVAIRAGAELLPAAADVEALARHTCLRLAGP